jgi:hypothetical protein
MIKKLHLDFETYSPVDINRTLANYAPACEVLLCAWAIDDGKTQMWDVAAGYPMPVALYEAAHDPDVWILAHNAVFEYQVIKHTSIFGPGDIPLERFYCSMTQALCHNLPAALETLGTVFKLAEDQAKMRDGKALVRWFCTPNELGVFRGMEPYDKWQRFKDYCVRDVDTMRKLHNSMPKINYPFDQTHTERILWLETERMNMNGFGVDLELANASVAMAARIKDRSSQDMLDATDGAVASATQAAALRKYLSDTYGVELPNMQAGTLERAVNDMSLPVLARELIQARIDASKASVAKYRKLIQCSDSRGRMTSTIIFCGASGTGRDAGRTFQPQNLPRPKEWFDGDYAEQLISEIKDQSLDLLHADPMAVMSSALRGAIIPAQGKKLVVSDLSNIEGRMVAYLAGEEWKTQYFRDYDSGKIKFDNYVAAASKMLGMKPEDVDKTTRQTGKVMELACFEANTQVLTSTGVKAIVEVLLTDLLWDGVEWVKHEGLIYKGLRETIALNGVRLTPDHLVLTQGIWRPAQQLATHATQMQYALESGSAALSLLQSSETALDTTVQCSAIAGRTPIKLPLLNCEILKTLGALSAERQKPSTPEKSLGRSWWSKTPTSKSEPASNTCLWCNAVAEPTPTTSKHTTFAAAQVPDVEPALKNIRGFGVKSTTATPIYCPRTTIGEGCLTELPPQSIAARTLKTSNTIGTADEASESTPYGPKTKNLFLRISLRCLDGMTQLLKWIGQTTTKDTNRVTYSSSAENKTKQTDEQCPSCKPESMSLRPVYDILNCGSRNRFTILSNDGALVVHNCGYGSGVGGILQFAEVYRVDKERLARETHKIADGGAWFATQEKFDWAQKNGFDYGLPLHQWTACDYLKQQWRNAHPNIARLWADCETAFRQAYMTPGVWFPAGQHLAYKRKGSWIFCRLPSGRVLCYISPKITEDEITYSCMDQTSHKWVRAKVYAGKFVAHATQASARDLLFQNMLKAKNNGYNCVMRVHDELICEVPDVEKYNADGLGAFLSSQHPWCSDIPLAAAGYETNLRYKKD